MQPKRLKTQVWTNLDQHQAGVLALRLRLSCRLSVVHSCSCAFRWRREVCTAGERTLGGVAIYCKGYCIKRANRTNATRHFTL